MIEKSCAVCAKPFQVKNYRADSARFCSTKCKWAGLAVERERPLIDRFWRKVDRRGPDECWPWTAATTFGGYGVIGEHGKYGRLIRAPRLSYEIANGPIPAGMIIRHTCDNPRCVNPAHLLVGTAKQNSDDKIRRNRANVHRRISTAQVMAIRAAQGTIRAIAKHHGVSIAYVCRVKNGGLRPHD